MGREVRMVPPTWQHPRNYAGQLKPLFDGREYHAKAARWIADFTAWENGTHPSLTGEGRASPATTKAEHRYWWDWDGNAPTADEHMLVDVPESERTHFQLYETTTEGTPLSPIFATLDELCDWAAENASTFADYRASAEDWKRMLSPGQFVHHEEQLPNGPRLIFL